MSKRRMKYHSNDEISYYNFLHSMKDKIVTVYRGGPEAIEGILVDNADGHYTIVKNQEVLRIYPFHIKSISLGQKGRTKKRIKKMNKARKTIMIRTAIHSFLQNHIAHQNHLNDH